ncbi:MAG TPA: crossover junction endodeoxyribonuclease RuvC [Gammaproteobacteria bacterium]|nr:crossover junction endodeoxyribonuclease RuvC [Gammaproteobacteria bacterium]
MRILGIDPGSIVTGYGVIELSANTETAVDYGCIHAKADDWPTRLKLIYDGITTVVDRCQPDEVAIETPFVHRNASSALKLGQARAAALCAVFAVAGGVAEYAPRAVKLAVVGTGAATKDQVQHMIKALLKLNEAPQADAADALAIALCHSHGRRARGLLAAGGTAVALQRRGSRRRWR